MFNEEQHIQMAVITWLKIQYPNVLFTIAPNGFKLPIGVAVKIKRLGYAKGTPDILIFEPMKGYHGLCIEMKAAKGVLSEEQLAWQQKLNDRGYKAIVCFSADEAIERISGYLNPLGK